jgi:SAM-dependent methyltransferase
VATATNRAPADRRAELIPPEILPLFDDVFARSCDLIEEYVARLAAAAFRSTGLAEACAEPATVAEAIARAGLVADVARVPAAWLLATLAARGWVERVSGAGDSARFRAAKPLPAPDPEEILAAQAANDERCLPSYRIAAMAAGRYPAVLRGELTGEQALFGADGIVAWSKYFSNANPLYAISNTIGAVAAARALADRGGAVLELGGGLGSGAEALLERVDPGAVQSYRFTEISSLFLRRAERALAARFHGRGLEFGPLDLDRPFGVAPGAFALVYGVNVLHVARDLAATLAEVRAALAPGGALVISECVRPFAGRPVYVELAFNLLASFRDPLLVPGWRPNGGFLTPEQWTQALAASGFRDVQIYPDIAAIRETFPQFVVAAVTARRA